MITFSCALQFPLEVVTVASLKPKHGVFVKYETRKWTNPCSQFTGEIMPDSHYLYMCILPTLVDSSTAIGESCCHCICQ